MNKQTGKHHGTRSDPVIKIIRVGETKVLGPLKDYDSYETFLNGVKSMYEIDDESNFKMIYNENDEKYQIDSQKQFDYIKKSNKSQKNRTLKINLYVSHDIENQQKGLDLSLSTICNDPILKQYTEILRKKITPPNEIFDKKFTEDSIACPQCLGTGRTKNPGKKSSECRKCNGYGERPMKDKWAFTKMLFEHMLRKCLLKPLENYFNLDLDETSKQQENILDLEKSITNENKNLQNQDIHKSFVSKKSNNNLKIKVICFY